MPSGLGRGLSSLIPKKINNYQDFAVDKNDNLTLVDANRLLLVSPEKISPNSRQPRQKFNPLGLEELAESIKENGLLQPLVVTPRGTDGYELIAGERRWRASKMLHLSVVPVLVREVSEQKKLELALIENLQRENLNPIETGLAYNQLINEFNLTQEAVSKLVGQDRSSVANILRLLSLPAEIQSALVERRISEAHAKYLLGLDNPVQQMIYFKKILVNDLSVKDTEKIIRSGGGTKLSRIKVDFRDKEREERLRNSLGTKVELKRGKKGGQIVVSFGDDEELERILDKLV